MITTVTIFNKLLSKPAEFASILKQIMPILRITLCAVAPIVALMCASHATAQDYPNRAIRIVTSPIGGGNDLISRHMAQGLSGPLGQPVIVDNRPSGGNTPALLALQAAADGYTLLLQSAPLWIGPLLQKTPFDPVKDFAPISLVGTVANVLVVHPSLPVKSVRDLIALANSMRGELNYATTGTGASNHLAGELFKHMAGINIVRVNYKGTSQSLSDLISGQVQLMFAIASSVSPHVKSARVRALAVTTVAPSAIFPGLPTVAASGLPGYESAAPYGLFAQAKTPDAIIRRLNQESVRFLHTADAKEKFLSAGAEVVASSPEQLAATIKSEIERLGKVIRDAGIRAD